MVYKWHSNAFDLKYYCSTACDWWMLIGILTSLKMSLPHSVRNYGAADQSEAKREGKRERVKMPMLLPLTST